MTSIRTRTRGIAAGAAAFVFALSLGGCARTEVFELPEEEIPLDWLGPVDADAPLWPNLDWWNNFGSPELTALIEEAQESNFTLQDLQRNLRLAEITLQEAGLTLFPRPSVSISTGASTSRSRANGSTVTGGSDSDFSVSANAGMSDILTTPLGYESSVLNYDSQIASIFDTRLQTMRAVANAYFALLSNRQQIVADELNLENSEFVLRIAQANFDAGLTVQLDLLQQRIATESTRLSLRQGYQTDLNLRAALAILLGRGVQGFDIEGGSLEELAVPSVRPGLPSELLRRRPDIVQQEINLQQAALSVDEARLAFFPSISLTGSANRQSPTLLDVISTAASSSVSISASLAQTLFQTGQRKRNLERQRLALEGAIQSYRETVIRAFNDIDITLSALQLSEDSLRIAESNLENAEESNRIALVRYDAGVEDFQSVLQAQQDLVSQRNQYLNAKLTQIQAVLDFYVALGGGWEYEPTMAGNR